ncbi:3-deoxy-7-phosphoheptulonate synthase [Lentzea sp. HUAS12]|uniref:3-deoxy-7-phosphoheptulonate synthase n=1 Tax=Lentzea sp. HUAS12 TaxID=2951806 RepID=UPI0020A1A721|nr:3-deoxy-7-phosphoheptulonate synthase [Lentzea sp. HUAS12]USX53527.1 3-deoxy-7-phosphoheptulonate synthase [Lentzea sp. HUAS12]
MAALLTAAAQQQPEWVDRTALAHVTARLAVSPPLVTASAVRDLRTVLANVALGNGVVVQAGDCAEDPAERTAAHVRGKVALLDQLADRVADITGLPVTRVGRIAGQFAKPRSQPTEWVDGRELPVFRGHMVNSPVPDPLLRQPQPRRILDGYHAAREIMKHLAQDARVWTSHEALLLDYETPMVRRDELGQEFLGSTHWPWIGNRTRSPEGPHVALLARVSNPVACKVGPGTGEDELLDLCERLDPDRAPGRLTLIARMGAGAAAEQLARLVRAVRGAGHPVIWSIDPMHGNTVNTPGALKTRFLEDITSEVRRSVAAIRGAGGVAGGLHVETTPQQVTECVYDSGQLSLVGECYTTFCDPRLNPGQALLVVTEWAKRATGGARGGVS